MMKFSYQKLLALCRENGITPTALEKTLHCGNGTIKKWSSVSPRLDKVSQVAAYFGVTVNDLMEPDSETASPPTSHVEIVRAICFDRGLPISKVEKDLGFSNGYFNPKKTHDIPYTKLCKIADYLGVSVEVLTGTEDRIKNPASTDAYGINEKLSRLSPELREQFVRFLALAKEDQDRAARFLEFAAQELESQR